VLGPESRYYGIVGCDPIHIWSFEGHSCLSPHGRRICSSEGGRHLIARMVLSVTECGSELRFRMKIVTVVMKATVLGDYEFSIHQQPAFVLCLFALRPLNDLQIIVICSDVFSV
jgi:hypothetical protein